jgi:adenylate cyclase
VAGRKPKLLIVDDEPDLLDFVERALRGRFDVSRCGSAESALGLLDRDPDFDVVVTDHHMPRLTGLELLERIGGCYPGLVRVLLSGQADLSVAERARDDGQIHSYVLKPVDSTALARAIDDAVAAVRGDPDPNGG